MKNGKTTCIAARRFPSNKKICTYSSDRNALLALIKRTFEWKICIYLDVQFVKIKNPVMNFFPVTLCHLPFVFQEFDVTFGL